MVDEHTLILETEPPISFIAGSTAIEKGAALKMTNPMTAAAATGDGDIPAGVAQSEKLTGETAVSIYRGGFFRATAGVAGVTIGKAIQLDATTSPVNRLVDADAGSINLFGICLETASTGVRFVYELKPIHSTVG